MKKRHQASGIGSQELANSPSPVPSPASGKHGFTLIEMLLATIISVMVFFAMGMVLTRCFSLWMDSMAHWKLAQYGRISRERIMHGGFADPAGGLLSGSNVNIVASWFALNVAYAAGPNFYGVCGYTNISPPRMYLFDQNDITPFWTGGYKGSGGWRWGMRNDNNAALIPDVELTSMTAALTNDLLTLTYTMRFSTAGRVFTQPQTIRAFLINQIQGDL
jgi:prepilin-type N-terminal cleavage/methylation domain-containing protein